MKRLEEVQTYYSVAGRKPGRAGPAPRPSLANTTQALQFKLAMINPLLHSGLILPNYPKTTVYSLEGFNNNNRDLLTT